MPSSGLRRAAVVVLVAAAGCGPARPSGPPGHFERTAHFVRFFKGNTHTHTERSGDAKGAPADVARWFKSNGYSFVVLTDHNRNGPPADLAEVEDASFLVIEGEEYTSVSETDGRVTHPHVNGLGTRTTVPGSRAKPTWKAVQEDVDAILAQGGVAQVNHPNHKWSLTFDDLRQVRGAALFEVANRHPGLHNKGDETRESVEAMWDRLLTAGQRLWGVASDDNHVLPDPAAPDNRTAVPGRGWVQVAAKSLTDGDVLAALSAGDFYFSTGLEFERVDVEGKTISVALRPPKDEWTIEFVGSGGVVLDESSELSASYTVRGGEGYVRVRAKTRYEAAGTQPFFVAAD